MTFVLGFLSGFAACFALLLFESFYPVRLRRKDEPDVPDDAYLGLVQ